MWITAGRFDADQFIPFSIDIDELNGQEVYLHLFIGTLISKMYISIFIKLYRGSVI
jgi:hypothetical protein